MRISTRIIHQIFNKFGPLTSCHWGMASASLFPKKLGIISFLILTRFRLSTTLHFHLGLGRPPWLEEPPSAISDSPENHQKWIPELMSKHKDFTNQRQRILGQVNTIFNRLNKFLPCTLSSFLAAVEKSGLPPYTSQSNKCTVWIELTVSAMPIYIYVCFGMIRGGEKKKEACLIAYWAASQAPGCPWSLSLSPSLHAHSRQGWESESESEMRKR